jgi:hypothetical protein
MKKSILTIVIGLALAGLAMAEIADFENAPWTPGFYIQGYPAYMTASKSFDNEGKSQDLANNWKGFGFALRPTYYGQVNNHRWTVSAAVPYMSVDYGMGETQSGIGDIQASVAYWPLDNYKKWNYLSAWVWADIPSGDDEKGLGTGQMNIRPGLAYCFDKFPVQMQVSALYNIRMENSDTKEKPGNELWFNWSLGYSFQPSLMASAEIESGFGQDSKLDGATLNDTKESWFKVGPAVQYQLTPNLGFKVKGLYNAFGKNTPQSVDLWARLNWSFSN